jgi:hypothetical protein
MHGANVAAPDRSDALIELVDAAGHAGATGTVGG